MASTELTVFDGKLSYPDPSKLGNATIMQFATYENYIPMETTQAPPPGIRELSTRELKADQASSERRIEIGSRTTLAFSPVALALVCVLTSLKMGRKSKGYGFGLALALLSAYWILLVLGTSLAKPWIVNPSYLFLGWLLTVLLP